MLSFCLVHRVVPRQSRTARLRLSRLLLGMTLSLGLATTLVMAASSGAVSGARNFVPHEIRIPVFVLIIAALVTVIDLAMNAFVHPLYLVLGIFIPLITTNCIVLARADAFAAKNHPLHSVIDAVAMGLGLTLVLVMLGAIRELAGHGTLLSGIDLVFGESAKQMVVHVLPDYQGFLLAILPPGAFIALGLLIAANNWRTARAARLAHPHAQDAAPAAA